MNCHEANHWLEYYFLSSGFIQILKTCTLTVFKQVINLLKSFRNFSAKLWYWPMPLDNSIHSLKIFLDMCPNCVWGPPGLLAAGLCGSCVLWTPPSIVDLVYHIWCWIERLYSIENNWKTTTDQEMFMHENNHQGRKCKS
jgi:hypothetical protein